MDIIILVIIIVVSGVLSTLLHFKCKAPTSKIEDATSGTYYEKDRKLDKKLSLAFFVIFILGIICLIHITIIPYIFK